MGGRGVEWTGGLDWMHNLGLTRSKNPQTQHTTRPFWAQALQAYQKDPTRCATIICCCPWHSLQRTCRPSAHRAACYDGGLCTIINYSVQTASRVRCLVATRTAQSRLCASTALAPAFLHSCNTSARTWPCQIRLLHIHYAAS